MNKFFTITLMFVFVFILTSASNSQNVEVSTGGPITNYLTLKAAFTAINAGTHTGIILIELASNTTETSTAVLNASGSGLANYTSITIKPKGGAARTITGNLGAPLIDLNGADNVNINGLNASGNTLTISNTYTASASTTCAIRFINDATNNLVTNCNLQGSMPISLTMNGGVVFFSTAASGGNGNDNNTISNCNIGPAGSNLPTKCIYGNGSQTSLNIANSGNIIDNNNIYDFFSPTESVSGIYINQGNDNWTISNNRIYQTAPRVFTTTTRRYAAITIATGSSYPGAFNIISNKIGFGSSAGTGVTNISGSTNTFRGIDIPSVRTTTATSIQGNIISGIIQSTSTTLTGTSTGFTAIMLGTTDGRFDVGNITGNTIGSTDGLSSIVINSSGGTGTINGIYDYSFCNNNISNNIIGNITIQGIGTSNGFRGILVNTSDVNNCTISNNTISGVTDNQVGNYAMYCINVISPSAVISGNNINNINGNANGAVVLMSGIAMISNTASGVTSITQNTIHSLNNTVTGGSAGAIYAMDLQLNSAANVIEKNFIHSCNPSTSVTGFQLYGIIMRGFGAAVYKNNIVRLGIKPDGSSITTGISIIGIRDVSGTTSSYYNNSVYIGGTGVISASNTICFLSNVVTNLRNFQNNIFWNARSNSSGNIANISIWVGGTVPNPPGLTSNYNLLYASGNSGVVGVFNNIIYSTIDDWRTATGQDLKSINGNPGFINATGNASTVDLHIDPSVIFTKGRGTYISGVSNDFDGDIRPITQSSTVSPVDIGADQFTASNYTGNVLTINGPAAYDGNLKAIEITSGSFNTMGLRQFTGVRPPNSSMLKKSNQKKTSHFDIENFPGKLKEVPGIISETKLQLTPDIIFDLESVKNDDLKRDNKINEQGYLNKSKIKSTAQKTKGNSGGSSSSSAIQTPWIYWEIDNISPITEPITLRFYYNDEQLATINETKLKISFWNGIIWDDTFIQSVNIAGNYVEVTLPIGQGWPVTSVFALEDEDSPLPVVLSKFDIFSTSRNVTLNWTTEMEINNKGFSIERRSKVADINYSGWKEISFVNGKGNTNSPVNYSFTDTKLNSGSYQYRLRQVDFNGNFEYFSPSVNTDIIIGKPVNFDLSQNYPNPSNPTSRIDFQIPFDGKVNIKVYDILGKEIVTLVNEYKSADFYTVEFDGSNLSSGTYFYRIIAEGNNQRFTKTMKMILIK
ncbi:MAG: T9SS type A sorting domain-containing protein [Ignavibacteria bacterium]|nr:T9SS type A sorting domain-containing protein [Ignavibacteria bacterium]